MAANSFEQIPVSYHDFPPSPMHVDAVAHGCLQWAASIVQSDSLGQPGCLTLIDHEAHNSGIESVAHFFKTDLMHYPGKDDN